MSSKLQQQADQNTKDIGDIKHSIDVIKNNHLHHIEADMNDLKRTINTMDMRLWAILILLVGAVVVGGIVNMIGL